MKRHTPRGTAVLFSALLATLVLALSACGSGSSSDSAESAAVSDSSGVGGDSDGSGVAGAQPETLAEDGAGATGRKAAEPEVAEPAIVSTGTISTGATKVAKARRQVQRVVDTYSGRITEQETGNDESDRLGYAHLVLRIPSESFEEAMADLERIGRLADSSTSSTDVTTQVVDTEVRVKNARASIDRIRTLLARAERIGDVIAIESELATREAELDSLLAQQASLADQTSMSTITVSISRTGLDPDEEPGAGFLPGLSAGWGALLALGTWLATAAGVLLPWLPVVAVVGLPLWFLRRRRAGSRAGTVEAAGGSESS